MKKGVSPEDDAVRLVVERRPVGGGFNLMSIQVPTGTPSEKSIRAGLRKLGFEFIAQVAGNRTVFAFYIPGRTAIDFAQLLGENAKTLVDSHCSYGSGTSCKHKDKYEYCVDEGATINRCDDRTGTFCSGMCVTWVPPTNCKEEQSGTAESRRRPTGKASPARKSTR